MRRRDRLLQAALIWAVVCPCVLGLSGGLGALAPGLPQWAVILVSTAFTVSLIEFAVTAWVERLVARLRGQSHAELLAERARDAPGPDPGPASNAAPGPGADPGPKRM